MGVVSIVDTNSFIWSLFIVNDIICNYCNIILINEGIAQLVEQWRPNVTGRGFDPLCPLKMHFKS